MLINPNYTCRKSIPWLAAALDGLEGPLKLVPGPSNTRSDNLITSSHPVSGSTSEQAPDPRMASPHLDVRQSNISATQSASSSLFVAGPSFTVHALASEQAPDLRMASPQSDMWPSIPSSSLHVAGPSFTANASTSVEAPAPRMASPQFDVPMLDLSDQPSSLCDTTTEHGNSNMADQPDNSCQKGIY